MQSPAPLVSSPSGGQTSRRGYRTDIQGLRGLAVLLVVAFHADWGLTGGYVGVDVFFVVSGFVIGRLLLDELDTTGTLDLRQFYARRARRLLPALATLSVGTVLVSGYLLNPDEPLRAATGTAVAASSFWANIYLYVTGGGYFAAADEGNPLLHTWSLSVEEQFYFLLPVGMLLVAWLWRRRRPSVSRVVIAWAVAAVAGVSLWLSWSISNGWTTPFDFGSAERLAFYGAPTRVWEFAAGVLLVFAVPVVARMTRSVATLLGAGGAAMVLYAAWRFDEATPFPGLAALLPVLGTVLLLATGDRSPMVERSLSRRWLVRLGDLSYSWYLWHWPVIVFTRILWPGSAVAVTSAALVSLLPAWLSYRFLERPLRANHRIVGW